MTQNTLLLVTNISSAKSWQLYFYLYLRGAPLRTKDRGRFEKAFVPSAHTPSPSSLFSALIWFGLIWVVLTSLSISQLPRFRRLFPFLDVALDSYQCNDKTRGKVMSQGANKLQTPFLANSIYSRNPISKMSINSCENQINSCRH